MKNIVIQTKIIPQGICLNFFGLFLTRDKSWIDKYVINHEKIHTAQQRELLWIPFYVIYMIEWLIRLCRFGSCNSAYMNISFEREAYSNGKNLDYLSSRKKYAQWRTLKKQ